MARKSSTSCPARRLPYPGIAAIHMLLNLLTGVGFLGLDIGYVGPGPSLGLFVLAGTTTSARFTKTSISVPKCSA